MPAAVHFEILLDTPHVSRITLKTLFPRTISYCYVNSIWHSFMVLETFL